MYLPLFTSLFSCYLLLTSLNSSFPTFLPPVCVFIPLSLITVVFVPVVWDYLLDSG